MKRFSKIIILMFLLGVTCICMSYSTFAEEEKQVIKKKMYIENEKDQTFMDINKKYWKKADTAILVNSYGTADKIVAAPYANIKNIPILLTSKDTLTENTKKEIERLEIKNILIIGGKGHVSENVANKLRAMGIKVERIAGDDRVETSLKVAKKIKDISGVIVINGLDKSILENISVLPPAIENKFIILLCDGKNFNNQYKFIKENNICKVYIIGKNLLISSKELEQLNAIRINGVNTGEINGKVIGEFYKHKNLDNICFLEDEVNNDYNFINNLISYLVVSKDNSPIFLVHDNLDKFQEKALLSINTKEITIINDLNEKVLSKIYKVLSYKDEILVTDLLELQNALKNCEDGQIIRFYPEEEIKKDYSIVTDKDIKVELNGVSAGKITVNMTEGTIINKGELEDQLVIKNGEFINEGTVEKMIINNKNKYLLSNDNKGVFDTRIIY